MTESILESESLGTSPLTLLFAQDLQRLRAVLARLRNNVTESDIHEYRVTIAVLLASLTLHSSLFKRLWLRDATTDLVLLSRLARKARNADVMYQQVLAFSLDSEVEIQAALQNTISRLNDKRQKARSDFAAVIDSEGYSSLFDSVVTRLEQPAARRSTLSLTDEEISALLATNAVTAIARFVSELRGSKKKGSRRQLHRLRLTAKRVRYALDGLPGETDALDLARETQGTLGSMRDAESLVRWLEKWSRKSSVTKLERHVVRAVIDAEKLRLKRLNQKFKKLRQHS